MPNDFAKLNELGPYGSKLKVGDYIKYAIFGPMFGFMNPLSRVFFVNPSIGTNTNNSGLSWNTPLKTVAAAIAKCTAGYNDCIVIQATPGTVITETDIAVAASDITFVGLNDPSGQSVIFAPASDAATIFSLAATADRTRFYNITFNLLGASTGACTAIALVGGCNGVTVKGCTLTTTVGGASVGITSTTIASCVGCAFVDNQFQNVATGIVGYYNKGRIAGNKFLKTVTGALTVMVSLLDNGGTADSDGCIIEANVGLGGIVNTTPYVNGIKVAAACYGVGIINNQVSGCADNLSHTSATAGCYAIGNLTEDGGQGGDDYANATDKLLA